MSESCDFKSFLANFRKTYDREKVYVQKAIKYCKQSGPDEAEQATVLSKA